jgi:hypothetical protein
VADVRVWARGGAALLVATLAGLMSASILTVTMPGPVTAPRPGSVLETVTPAQLVAMNVRLDPALQPVELPDWLTSVGVRLPATVLLAGEAEAAVRKNSAGVRTVAERALTYATLTGTPARPRGPTIAHRLVWAVVGTRAAAGSVGGVLPVLWLVDAKSGRQLVELTVLGPAPAGGAAAAAGGGSGP